MPVSYALILSAFFDKSAGTAKPVRQSKNKPYPHPQIAINLQPRIVVAERMLEDR
jgi:hypothetical protein